MTTIIDGRKIRDEILVGVKAEVLKLPIVPVFCDIVIGEDPVSLQYVNMKAKTAESVGIKFRSAHFPSSITTTELVDEITNLNRVPHICGIIVQLPLPSNIDTDAVINTIDPKFDVDCLSSISSSRFYNGNTELAYPTALACMNIIDSLGFDLSNKKIVILGQGMLVGKPVSYLLRKRGLDITTIDSRTENISTLLLDADIVISAIGHGKYISGDMVKSGSVIIDAGTSELDSGIVGDVDITTVMDKAGFISPVPGGVGPVTIAMLLQNVLKVAQEKSIN